MLRTTQGFAIGAAASAAVGGLVLAVVLPSSLWGAAGFAATAIPGLVFGVALSHVHGRPGGTFPALVGAGLFVRAAAAGLVTALAAESGGPRIPEALAGIAAGFVAVTAFEMFWFVRRGTERVRG